MLVHKTVTTALRCRLDVHDQGSAGGFEAPRGRVLRLFDLAQVAVAELVNVRNVLPLLDWADMSRARLVKDVCLQVRCSSPPLLYGWLCVFDLDGGRRLVLWQEGRTLCTQVVINNLDAVLMEPIARATFTSMLETAPELIAEIEIKHQERLCCQRRGAKLALCVP